MSAYEDNLKASKLRPHRERLERIATAVLAAIYAGPPLRVHGDIECPPLAETAAEESVKAARALIAAIDGDTQ